MNRRHLLKLLLAAPFAALGKPVLVKTLDPKSIPNPDYVSCSYRTYWLGLSNPPGQDVFFDYSPWKVIEHDTPLDEA